jgi:divalent metal cation (Fe/Co/Zn/Cd) transporter
VEAIVKREFAGRISNITHFTCHYHSGTLEVLLDVTMNNNLTIDQATRIAEELRLAIISNVPDIHEVDVHLDLLDYI